MASKKKGFTVTVLETLTSTFNIKAVSERAAERQVKRLQAAGETPDDYDEHVEVQVEPDPAAGD